MLLHTKVCKKVARPDDHHRHVCLCCNYHTYYNANMRKHLRKHTGDKPFKCANCERRFSRKDSLQTHIVFRHGRKHTGVKPFKCPNCETRFSRKDSLRMHMKGRHVGLQMNIKTRLRKHTRDKPFKCSKM